MKCSDNDQGVPTFAMARVCSCKRSDRSKCGVARVSGRVSDPRTKRKHRQLVAVNMISNVFKETQL